MNTCGVRMRLEGIGDREAEQRTDQMRLYDALKHHTIL
jgi:hypothetical protein